MHLRKLSVPLVTSLMLTDLTESESQFVSGLVQNRGGHIVLQDHAEVPFPAPHVMQESLKQSINEGQVLDIDLQVLLEQAL